MKRPPLFALAAFAVVTLTVGSAAQAQISSQALDAAASSRSVQQQLSALSAQVASLQNQVAALQRKLAAAHDVLALEPFVSVDPSPQNFVTGPNVTFKGANIHIVSGSGDTNDNGNPRGLGNLIIGYDEFPGQPASGGRGGSHNLVIGRNHQFTRNAIGGFVTGFQNIISGEGASVSAGAGNTANGLWASVSGGTGNTALSVASSVTGGADNTATAESTVSGGRSNTASGGTSSIVGGLNNTVSGEFSVVIGGTNVTDSKGHSIAPQPPFPNYP